MSAERSDKSHAMAWTFSVLAVPVLYLLSWGPVYGMELNGIIPHPHPEWIDDFYDPAGWLHAYTPLHDSIDAYIHWWGRLMEKH